MTVIIPIFRRSEARIVLLTDIWKILTDEPSVRLVLIVPPFKADEYRKEIRSERVVIESVDVSSAPRSFLDALFYRLSLFYADTPASRYERKRHILLEQKRYIRYAFSLAILMLLGNARRLRRVLRFLDLVLVRDRSYDRLFDTYHPDVIFMPSITHWDEEVFLREAKRRGIRTIALISSPEEIAASRLPFRIVPDHLLVENEVYRREAIRLFDTSGDRVFVVGNPLFDRYRAPVRISKQVFCKQFGINPSHRVILFASVGDLNPSEWQVLKDLDTAVQNGALPRNLTILVRHYPEKNIYTGGAEYSGHIIFDNSNILFAKDKTYLGVLSDEMASFTDMFAYADAVVSTAGKLMQTAAAFDKPIINLAYDGWEEKPLHKSVRRFYIDEYPSYRHMKKSGAVVLARSRDELIDYLTEALEHPESGKKERKQLFKELAPCFDGKAGERVGRAVFNG